ncbi:MAG TPA: FadR/GntR family transcriptional regulator [Anaerolineae bacterium]|nr:FadR/GntR family transcriptional regulator [Anaerolineae bacterium]
MTFEPFEKDVLPKKIATRLLSLIKEKQLRPGDKLPPERELAVMMQVSRPSLREALQALAIMNIIEMRQGDGTYVTSLEPELLVEPLDFVFSLNDSTLLELFEARKIVEVGIVALAAQRITAAEIQDLETCLEKSLKASDNPRAFLEADLELHKRIVTAAQNPLLGRFMDSISQLGLVSRSRTTEIPGLIKQSAADHQAIVAALKAHDPEAAQQAMLRHLDNVEQKLKALIPENEVLQNI